MIKNIKVAFVPTQKCTKGESESINQHISRKQNNGFTLLEVLMVIGILAILAGVVLVAINPARQFKIARDSQRSANINTILNAIGQNITDHSGSFVCEGQVTSFPTESTKMSSENFDIARCLVPDYVSVLPFDPSKEDAGYVDENDYNTGYGILVDAEGRIKVSADGELNNTEIAVKR